LKKTTMRWKKDPVQQDSQARQEPFIIAHPDGMRSRSPVPIIEWAGQKGPDARHLTGLRSGEVMNSENHAKVNRI
jgi:hypothetical protein